MFIIAGTHGLSSANLDDALKNIKTPNHTIFTKETVPVLRDLILGISVIFSCQVALQTFIITIASKTKYLQSIKQTRPLLAVLCWCLAFCNFFKWLDSSLNLSSVAHTNPVKELVFSRSTSVVIARSLFPMILFYRFHSVHLLFETGLHLHSVQPEEELRNMDDDSEILTSTDTT